jgi:hypothetical protein
MRSSRPLSILLLLQTRRQLTARELADELEVSLRPEYLCTPIKDARADTGWSRGIAPG